jgi:predicted nucleic acid-binding protein
LLLDSNILILAATGQHDELLSLFEGGQAMVSAVSKIEVLGFPRLTREDEAGFQQLFGLVAVLPVTDAVIEHAIKLRRMRKISLGDAIVAATALAHGVPLATANVDDFAWIDGLEIVNPVKS